MKTNSRPRGRPRSFDREGVLDCAVTTFWAKGYKGTSVDDLTESMGINRPSMYATFGSKHDLFMEVIDRYVATHGCQPVKALLAQRDAMKAVAAFFDANIRCATSRGGPRGCLIANVATEAAQKDVEVGDKLSALFADTDRVIADYLEAAQDRGQFPRQSDPSAVARMIVSITHSFATRARVGARRKELSRLAKEFMEVLFPATSRNVSSRASET